MPYYRESTSLDLTDPTDSVDMLARYSSKLLEYIYKPGIQFKKCAVMLSDLIDKNKHIPELFADHTQIESNDNLMQAYEHIHKKLENENISRHFLFT